MRSESRLVEVKKGARSDSARGGNAQVFNNLSIPFPLIRRSQVDRRTLSGPARISENNRYMAKASGSCSLHQRIDCKAKRMLRGVTRVRWELNPWLGISMQIKNWTVKLQ